MRKNFKGVRCGEACESLVGGAKMEVGASSGNAAEPVEGTPFLFADGVAAFGAVNGTVHVVLEAYELAVDDQQT